jgi:hypothetical protein
LLALFLESRLRDVLCGVTWGRTWSFPALIVTWQWSDARFHLLKASRGLTVSAVRSSGKTDWVYLTAPVAHGGDYAVTVPDDISWTQTAPQALPSSIAVAKAREMDGVWVVSLGANESVALWPAGQAQPQFTMAPLDGNRSEFNYW